MHVSPQWYDAPTSIADEIRLTDVAKCPLHFIGRVPALASALYLLDEHCETQEILGPEARPARGDDLKGVRRRQARPASRHGVNRAVGRLVPDAITMTTAALIDEDELASVLRMERMDDANPLSRLASVGCNW